MFEEFEKNLVPYEVCLKYKNIGFVDECYCVYTNEGTIFRPNVLGSTTFTNDKINKSLIEKNFCTAILWLDLYKWVGSQIKLDVTSHEFINQNQDKFIKLIEEKKIKMNKKILYIDMDGVVADLFKGVKDIDPTLDFSYGGHNEKDKKDNFIDFANTHTTLFENLPLIKGALNSCIILNEYFDIYLLSTPMWEAPSSYTSKALWVKKHFPEIFFKKLILSHHKNLCAGAIIVDDTFNSGVDKFDGTHIHFGSEKYPNWEVVLPELLKLK